MRLRYASLTHRGMVRGNNQDFVGEFVRENRWALFLVADGMGGHQKGEVASNMAVRNVPFFPNLFETGIANTTPAIFAA